MPHLSRRVAAIFLCLVPSISTFAVEPPAPTRRNIAGARDPVILYSTRADNKLHILDADDLSLVASKDLGVGAHELAVSPDHRFALGTAYGGPGPGHQPADNRIAVFDLEKHRLHRTIDLGTLKRPNDAAFMPDSKHAYVTVEQPPRIVKLSADTGEFTTIELEKPTNHMLALSPDAKRLYVAHVMPGSISVIDTAEDKVIANHPVPDGAEGLAVSHDNSRVWVSCNRSDRVVVLDAATGKIEHELKVEGFPFRLRLSPDGKTAAVTCPKSDDLALINTADPQKVRRVSLRGNPADADAPPLVPTSLAFTPDGKHLAIVCSGPDPEIVLVDFAAGKVAHRRKSDGQIPDALAAALLGSKC
ncbi:MAG: YncE family protein [Phycisphaerales bacterium]